MRTLLTADAIADRVRLLGRQISADYAGQPLLIVGVLHGSVVLVADLIRAISIPHQIAFVRAASYGSGTTSSGVVQTAIDNLPPLEGRHLLLVDDIFDTGRTLQTLTQQLAGHRPASTKSAVLLWKTARREVDALPDYFAFQIPDEFVVGYGLDYNGDYRHLPEIAVLEPEDLAPGQNFASSS